MTEQDRAAAIRRAQIDLVLEQDALSPPPSPEGLVNWLSNSQGVDNSQFDREMAMARVVRAAERGGTAHMEAVAGWVAKLPPPPPDPKDPVYEMRDGRMQAAWHQNSVLIELRVKIDGRSYKARETVDPFMFERRFQEEDEFERFLAYFIRRALGEVASSPEAYAHFRSKLWIVKPDDLHDLQRCAQSKAFDSLPHCVGGLIMRPELSPVGGSARPAARCVCRCHKVDGSGAQAENWARIYLLPDFDEDVIW